jgi:ADP-ribosylglycohydrolase
MEDRFVGSLIGQCLGDALGFVVEGYPAAECRGYVEDYLRAGRAGALGRAPFAFGQYTDDSQLARELLQSFVARGRFEPADYARRLAAIFAEGRIVGRGRTTEAAALRLAAGVAWQEAGTPAPNAGNGSAMRAGPVGLMFHDDEAALARAAHDQGRMTHADPRCSAGAVAIAGAVARALRGEAATPAELAALAGRYDASVAAEIGRLDFWLALPPEQAAPGIARAGLQPGFSDLWDGISPFVTSSVVWSLYAFLRSPADYWETICTAIAVGGDVDTTAAMAGAISGAYNGLAAVPEEPARGLTDRGSWGFEELRALARDAWALKAGAGAAWD